MLLNAIALLLVFSIPDPLVSRHGQFAVALALPSQNLSAGALYSSWDSSTRVKVGIDSIDSAVLVTEDDADAA